VGIMGLSGDAFRTDLLIMEDLDLRGYGGQIRVPGHHRIEGKLTENLSFLTHLPTSLIKWLSAVDDRNGFSRVRLV
jgi:hypothetical protein